jgi:hypothetical protein
MKVYMILVLFSFLFTPAHSFGQDESQYLVSYTNAKKVCGKVLSRNLQGKPSVCSLTDDFGGDAIVTSVTKKRLYVGVSNTSGGSTARNVQTMEIGRVNGNVRFSDRKSLPAVQNPGSFYNTQTMKVGTIELRVDHGSEAAITDRLFIAGTQNTSAANDYLAFALDSEGDSNGSKSVVFSNPNSKTTLGGSVSRDGGMAVELTATRTTWTLTTRRLKNGLPAGAPFSWTIPAYHGYSPDLTNTILVSSNVAGESAIKFRYLIYRAFRNVGTSTQQSQIMIQKIDDATGKPIEAAKPLTVFKNSLLAAAEAFQSLAISPNAELLLFTEYSGACKKMILKATKIANGTLSGPAKVVAGCEGLASTPLGYIGIDIVESPFE